MEERKNDKYYWIIIIFLIIIILLLLFFARFGKIENKYLVPTGNIDVFDIDIECSCGTDGKCVNKDSIYPVWNEQNYKNEFNKIYVDDKDGDYIYHQNLDIFGNPFYEYTSKIAPGVFNTYYFVVHNSSNINVNWNFLWSFYYDK